MPILIICVGVAEYLFRSRERIEAAILASLSDRVFRSDDLEFTVAARGWSECVSFGNFDLYERRFSEVAGEWFGYLECFVFSCFTCTTSVVTSGTGYSFVAAVNVNPPRLQYQSQHRAGGCVWRAQNATVQLDLTHHGCSTVNSVGLPTDCQQCAA